MTKLKILCGACKCAVQTVSNPKANDQVTCPRCNRSDRFDKVMAAVREYVGHCAQTAMHESLTRAARGSRFIKLTSKKPSNRSFRWVTSDMGI